MEKELELLIDPTSLEALLESQRYAQLVEKYQPKKAAIILARAFTQKLQEELRQSDNSWAADAIEDAKKSFILIVARRYQKLLTNIVQ